MKIFNKIQQLFCSHKWEFIQEGLFTIDIHRVKGKKHKCNKCEKEKIEY